MISPRRIVPAISLATLVLVSALRAQTPGIPPPEPKNSAPAVELPALVVTAARIPQAPGYTAAVVDRIDAASLNASSTLTIDDALRRSSAFSLFRRTSSLTANPTAQGVSLRGLGPSGASRSLVLLDGIPLNDPFGGWVAWSKLPRLTLAGAEIARGAGSGVWGNGALGGTIQILERPLGETGGALALDLGADGLARAETFATVQAPGDVLWRLGARVFRTDGPEQYAAAQRGPIDRRLDSTHTLLHTRASLRLPSGLALTGGLHHFDEERGNGTPGQRNRSRESAAHLRLAGDLGDHLTLDTLVYGQSQRFAATFTTVDAARATETPSLDQFDVPATAGGAAVVLTSRGRVGSFTAVGADVRAVRGETREDFFFSAGAFQRRRFAGGEQLTGGAFLSHQHDLLRDVTIHAAARVDQWFNRDGRRREWTKSNGAILREEEFSDTRGTEFSPGAGLVWRASPHFRWRASAYRAFRVPTLNEYYRPFRVGSVATEANPNLARESAFGREIGLEWNHAAWSGRLTAFASDLHDGVANVTLSATPQLIQRQRLNLDRVRSRGLEGRVQWERGPLTAAVDLLFVDTRVTRAAAAPALVGRRLAQVPVFNGTARVVLRPARGWLVEVALRGSSRQFEDDENALPLASAVSGDVRVGWRMTAGQEVYLAVENVADSSIETGRGGGGLVQIAPGRQVRAGWSITW